MPKRSVDTSRIFRNSISLYLRLILTMFFTLYSSRLVLKYLGIEDYGLYHVVAGVVALCSFLSSSMTNATQRFISFEIGKGDLQSVNKIFNVCLITHILIAVIIVVIAESLGLWFINTYVNIPEGRNFAANIIFQTSIFILAISVISIPYMSIFISHEEMNVYASIGIAEAFLKLVVAYLLCISPIDHLVFYGILMGLVSFLSFFSYFFISRNRHEETHINFFWNSKLFKSIFSFSSWSVMGQFAIIIANHSTNILVNMFHGVTANAAMGIGTQVNGAMQSLAANIQTAYKPQIVKTFSANDFDNFFRLINQATKFAFLVLFVVSIPVIINMDLVLNFWLGNYPPYTIEFCVLFILASVFNTIGAAFGNSVEATGKIKEYQLVTSFMFLSDVALVYLFFLWRYPPIACMVIKATLNFLVIFMRIFFAKRVVPSLPVKLILKQVLYPIFLVFSLVSVLMLFYYEYVLDLTYFYRFVFTVLISIVALFFSYFIILTKSEREHCANILVSTVKKKHE